jgi:glutathione S-transferase
MRPDEGAMGEVTLHGYVYSVYTRIARAALVAKGVAHRLNGIDPFSDADAARLAPLHPFGRVPVLEHDGFRVFETVAVTRYVDRAFPGPPLNPADARAEARVAQCVAVVDAYGYRPMVRQVFAHRVFRPWEGLAGDEAEIAAGVAASRPVLDTLEAFAREGLILPGSGLSLADLHLGPMIDYFAMAPEGRRLLAERPALSAWWARFSEQPCMRLTRPPLG